MRHGRTCAAASIGWRHAVGRQGAVVLQVAVQSGAVGASEWGGLQAAAAGTRRGPRGADKGGLIPTTTADITIIVITSISAIGITWRAHAKGGGGGGRTTTATATATAATFATADEVLAVDRCVIQWRQSTTNQMRSGATAAVDGLSCRCSTGWRCG